MSGPSSPPVRGDSRPCELQIPYRELCIAIARFFKTGIAPVDLAETIDICPFLEAAALNKRSATTERL